MFNIKLLNKISEAGLGIFEPSKYNVSAEAEDPDAVMVRSFNMNEMDMGGNLKAIARAGAGVNNIPVSKCTDKGIVVFNTPGANANGVKELVIASLLISSRRIVQGINRVQSMKDRCSDVAQAVEKEKSAFEGPEIKGKKLGVIGLGAIGSMVANDAVTLGMEVCGYDPYISVDFAWSLSREVKRENDLDHLLATCDYISLHVPLLDETKNMLDKKKFAVIKKGARIINLARAGLVSSADLIEAVENGIISCYVTDFPEECMLGHENIITIPHLGASTPESEDNCALMAAQQLRDFLEKGNIRNSVNMPECVLEKNENKRITIININIPNMLGQFTGILAGYGINIERMLNHHKNGIAYTIIDVGGEIPCDVLEKLSKIEGVIKMRVIG